MDERQKSALAPAWRNAGRREARLDVLVLVAPTPVFVGIAVHRTEDAVGNDERTAEEEIEVVLGDQIGTPRRDRALLRAIPNDRSRTVDMRIIGPDRQIVDVVEAAVLRLRLGQQEASILERAAVERQPRLLLDD